MRRRMWGRGLALALAGLVALSSGGLEARGENVHAAAAPLPQGQRVTVSTPSTGLFEMAFIAAMRRGYFVEEGLDIQRVQMAPGVSVAAVLAGEAEYALAPGSAVVAIVGSDAPFKVIMGMAVRALHVLMTTNPAVQTVPDLRGRAVATNTMTDSSASQARAVLRTHGLETPADFALQPLGQSPNRLAAMLSGQVQGVILDLAHASEAQHHGARILATPDQMLEVPTSGTNLTETRLREQPQQAEAMVRASLRGLYSLYEDRPGSIALFQDYLTLGPDAAAVTYDLGLRSFSADGTMTDLQVQNLIDIAAEATERSARVTPAQVADFSIVRRLHAQLGR
jgi:ABC-type nitrate/sulfonate/bicarbonate transport system substrate-binding protein